MRWSWDRVVSDCENDVDVKCRALRRRLGLRRDPCGAVREIPARHPVLSMVVIIAGMLLVALPFAHRPPLRSSLTPTFEFVRSLSPDAQREALFARPASESGSAHSRSAFQAPALFTDGLRVLLVSPKLDGPSSSSDVGRSTLVQALSLVARNASVTVLLVPSSFEEDYPSDSATWAAWVASFASLGVRLETIEPGRRLLGLGRGGTSSWNVLRWILHHSQEHEAYERKRLGHSASASLDPVPPLFDVILVSEYLGLGYFPALARRLGVALSSTPVFLLPQGSWTQTVRGQRRERRLRDLTVQYLERAAWAHADLPDLPTPSAATFGLTPALRSPMPALPLFLPSEWASAPLPRSNPWFSLEPRPVRHLVVLGPIDVATGLWDVCSALQRLHAQWTRSRTGSDKQGHAVDGAEKESGRPSRPSRPIRVTFLGPEFRVQGVPAHDWLARWAQEHGIPFESSALTSESLLRQEALTNTGEGDPEPDDGEEEETAGVARSWLRVGMIGDLDEQRRSEFLVRFARNDGLVLSLARAPLPRHELARAMRNGVRVLLRDDRSRTALSSPFSSVGATSSASLADTLLADEDRARCSVVRFDDLSDDAGDDPADRARTLDAVLADRLLHGAGYCRLRTDPQVASETWARWVQDVVAADRRTRATASVASRAPFVSVHVVVGVTPERHALDRLRVVLHAWAMQSLAPASVIVPWFSGDADVLAPESHPTEADLAALTASLSPRIHVVRITAADVDRVRDIVAARIDELDRAGRVGTPSSESWSEPWVHMTDSHWIPAHDALARIVHAIQRDDVASASSSASSSGADAAPLGVLSSFYEVVVGPHNVSSTWDALPHAFYARLDERTRHSSAPSEPWLFRGTGPSPLPAAPRPPVSMQELPRSSSGTAPAFPAFFPSIHPAQETRSEWLSHRLALGASPELALFFNTLGPATFTTLARSAWLALPVRPPLPSLRRPSRRAMKPGDEDDAAFLWSVIAPATGPVARTGTSTPSASTRRQRWRHAVVPLVLGVRWFEDAGELIDTVRGWDDRALWRENAAAAFDHILVDSTAGRAESLEVPISRESWRQEWLLVAHAAATLKREDDGRPRPWADDEL